MTDRYVWLLWSSAFLVPWAALYIGLPRYRRVMLHASWVTALFGLTEPLFVPEYWNPPTLFDLARRTGSHAARARHQRVPVVREGKVVGIVSRATYGGV